MYKYVSTYVCACFVCYSSTVHAFPALFTQRNCAI